MPALGLKKLSFIRYPGGKQRIADQFLPFLPSNVDISGTFVEPFLGGGTIFFLIHPVNAVLADISEDLITLYQGIKQCPKEIWAIFNNLPSTKEGYYKIRDNQSTQADLAVKAARILYLNRTCFKGMWRQNSLGQFNVGYGGLVRRWVIDEELLVQFSLRLQNARLLCSDFQPIIDECSANDFVFVDPPYRPGERELVNSHYSTNKFSYAEHERLATVLDRASKKGIKWALTISSHIDILKLYREYYIHGLSKCTGKSPGILTSEPSEVLICNYSSEVCR
jgi:DNA adenine methylase